jgi:hypothetical protein
LITIFILAFSLLTSLKSCPITNANSSSSYRTLGK